MTAAAARRAAALPSRPSASAHCPTVDITTMTRSELRSEIGMVLQDTWLFGGTILNYYDPSSYGTRRVTHVTRRVP